MLASILFIWSLRPTAAQMETALVLNAVLKLSRGPISINKHFLAEDDLWLKKDVFWRVVSKVSDKIHSSFCSSSELSFAKLAINYRNLINCRQRGLQISLTVCAHIITKLAFNWTQGTSDGHCSQSGQSVFGFGRAETWSLVVPQNISHLYNDLHYWIWYQWRRNLKFQIHVFQQTF